MNQPPIPIRFRGKGNIEGAKALIPFARKKLYQMVHVVGLGRFSKYASRTQNRQIRLNCGSVINMRINHNLSFVDIFVPVREGEGVSNKQYYDVCFSNVNFAVCRVVSRVDYGTPSQEGYISDNVRYNLEVCNKTNNPCLGGYQYVVYENMMITDFTDVVPDAETTGNEAGWINCGLVLLYTFDPDQMGELPTNPPDKACSPKRPAKETTKDAVPIYKVIPLFEPIEGDVDVVPEWLLKDMVCQ